MTYRESGQMIKADIVSRCCMAQVVSTLEVSQIRPDYKILCTKCMEVCEIRNPQFVSGKAEQVSL